MERNVSAIKNVSAVNVLHNVAKDNEKTTDNEKTEDDEPPSKYQRSHSTESLQDDLDLFNWLSKMF